MKESGKFQFDMSALLAEAYAESSFEIQNGVLVKYNGKESEIIVPDGVKEIGEYAFKNATHLRKITFPDSLQRIRKRAFWGCTSLSAILIPLGTERIEEGAFTYCCNLKDVVIPISVVFIGTDAFAYCGALKEISIRRDGKDYHCELEENMAQSYWLKLRNKTLETIRQEDTEYLTAHIKILENRITVLEEKLAAQQSLIDRLVGHGSHNAGLIQQILSFHPLTDEELLMQK